MKVQINANKKTPGSPLVEGTGGDRCGKQLPFGTHSKISVHKRKVIHNHLVRVHDEIELLEGNGFF